MNGDPHSHSDEQGVEMPAPTAAPLVLALGLALAAAGVAMNFAFLAVGAVVTAFGVGLWISQLLPGRGHCREPWAAPHLQPLPVTVKVGGVTRLRQGMPGYRLRLPERVHPISAGIKGGLLGGLVMPLPALTYGYLSGHGIWFPINLLAGMAMPGVGEMSIEELEQYRPTLLALSATLHVVVSLTMGLIYGALLPTLPRIPKPLAWGALLMPLLWTAASFAALSSLNATVAARIDWPWFVVSQFIFGVVAATIYSRWAPRHRVSAGLTAGLAGGLLMPIPALLWGIITKHGIWYPVNLLATMAVHRAAEPSTLDLEQFHADWFLAACVAHAVLSLAFGLAFAVVLPHMPHFPVALAWGGLLMPLMWTAFSYSLMGIVNPVLQEYVDWPWFIVSQFVFGVMSAIVVDRSEQIYIPPAGQGTDPSASYLTS